MVITIDILPYICEHITTLCDLGKLCRVNKVFRHHITHANDAHWMRIGKSICGAAYWNAGLFEYILGRVDGRYTTMLHVCPWMSLPQRFELETLKAYEAMGVTVELEEMKVLLLSFCSLPTFLTPQAGVRA